MQLRDLLIRNRSYRRFDENYRIDRSILTELVELSRCCASAANRQPLRFLIAGTPEETDDVFPHLHWAAGLTDWDGPEAGERPSAYIIILRDASITGSCEFDVGIAAQSILLGAVEQGLGGCMIGSIDQKSLRAALSIPNSLDIILVLAIGKPAETVVIDELNADGDTSYWRDEDGIHHVPKRALADLLVQPKPTNG